ncbi:MULTISPECIES: GNAT family N-acetyltransferase [Acetobacter]|uniref:Acetyltransferase n=1 Tax=Acetobacter senegalensis TaxID=446692 RepID=A0A149TVR0_9PROT|nr:MULTISPECIES: GNAT family N-acetyltransferase [Acetobacter]KXV57241.1 acetyltransferase [Acetobacter senegalensis]MCC6105232.1 GNAT family N-acetyltransferase [Acetobacter sp.]MCG4257640.1 GNAT family N-acetyltransferase [Acetobacter senegalensis]MCG4261676.1 GNAT family N-acetyltransferase [Acetobacter senegalensis]MCG4267706.1 GNAT family N-acetyltransferase [Acetobacter senegalensis]
MSDARTVRTGRLVLQPVTWRDMEDMVRLKADGGAFGQMLGGVCTRQQAERDMADDIAFWACHRVGIFTIHEHGKFVGMTGIHDRPDGRGFGLRFALYPWASGRGIAREAANAALSFTHNAGIPRVVAVAKETNLPSRSILKGIGMRECETFERDGQTMVVYESIRPS